MITADLTMDTMGCYFAPLSYEEFFFFYIKEAEKVTTLLLGERGEAEGGTQ